MLDAINKNQVGMEISMCDKCRFATAHWSLMRTPSMEFAQVPISASWWYPMTSTMCFSRAKLGKQVWFKVRPCFHDQRCWRSRNARRDLPQKLDSHGCKSWNRLDWFKKYMGVFHIWLMRHHTWEPIANSHYTVRFRGRLINLISKLFLSYQKFHTIMIWTIDPCENNFTS